MLTSGIFARRTLGRGICALILISGLRSTVLAQEEPVLVNIKAVDPTILIEMRYCTDRNAAHRALYPHDFPALIRPSVARQLVVAQKILRKYQFGLKIWDAYRPPEAQIQLWTLAAKENFVSNPSGMGSTHTWGVSVDATLTDTWGRVLSMPTDFDEFTPAAMLRYTGTDPMVRAHLRILQHAMANAGFYGLRSEWWHFTAEDWKNYGPIKDIRLSAHEVAPEVLSRAGADEAKEKANN